MSVDQKSEIVKQLEDLKKAQYRIETMLRAVEHAETGLKTDKHCPYPEIRDEIINQLAGFVSSNMKPQKKVVQSKETETTSTSYPKYGPPATAPVKSTQEDNVPDKIKFLMAHRHFEAKSVVFTDDAGDKVQGRVTGLDQPYVVIKTENGKFIRTEPKNLKIVGE